MSVTDPDQLQELAALYALGLLEGEEMSAFESSLAAAEQANALALAYRQATEALLDAVPAKAPPAGLRSRLLARLPGAAQQAPAAGEIVLGPGILLVQGHQKPWEETGIPGIRKKILYHDRQRNHASTLVSMKAGSIFPRHWHADVEELFMLSGTVRLSGHTLGVGDYCRADPDTLHEEVVAESDCVFIAMASTQNNYRIPPAARI